MLTLDRLAGKALRSTVIAIDESVSGSSGNAQALTDHVLQRHRPSVHVGLEIGQKLGDLLGPLLERRRVVERFRVVVECL